jgi:glycerol-1-phosphate dehydrogenase [NAD(P)+]
MDLNRYRKPCACGKTHDFPTKEIFIEPGAARHLPGLMERLSLPKRCVIVCDKNTAPFAEPVARQVGELLHPLKSVIVLNPANLHADEHAVEKVENQLPFDAGWLIAVGSGTIHDITRYVAHHRGIPFLSYPTAASVDGFVSQVCAMTWHGYKVTKPGTAPLAVLADTTVFVAAPYRLTASGMSDVLGKYIALADWKIAHLLGLENHCQTISDIMQEAVDQIRAAMPGVRQGDADAMEQLMSALLLSGIAMQLWGESRPASGGEHHLSHFWEMEVRGDRLDALHGEKVGVGLNLLLDFYARIANEGDFAARVTAYKGLPTENIRRIFGSLADDVLAANAPDPLANLTREKLLEQSGNILAILRDLPDAKAFRAEMDAAGCLTSLTHIGLTDDILADSLRYSPYVRGRVSFLRICNLMMGGAE